MGLLSDEFRACAHECLKRAQEAHTLQRREYWAHMAQLWLNLAQHVEQNDGDLGDIPIPDRPFKQDGNGDQEIG